MNEDPQPQARPEPMPEQSAEGIITEEALKDPTMAILIGTSRSFLGLAYQGKATWPDE